MDVPAATLDFVGVKHPGTKFRGREVAPMKGVSWVQYMKGQKTFVHDEDHVTGWELFGRCAVRQGKWKATFIAKPWGRGCWELFNLNAHPGENHDLSKQEPEIFKKMVEHYV
jgi:arylsulfatase A-like enzyme